MQSLPNGFGLRTKEFVQEPHQSGKKKGGAKNHYRESASHDNVNRQAVVSSALLLVFLGGCTGPTPQPTESISQGAAHSILCTVWVDGELPEKPLTLYWYIAANETHTVRVKIEFVMANHEEYIDGMDLNLQSTRPFNASLNGSSQPQSRHNGNMTAYSPYVWNETLPKPFVDGYEYVFHVRSSEPGHMTVYNNFYWTMANNTSYCVRDLYFE